MSPNKTESRAATTKLKTRIRPTGKATAWLCGFAAMVFCRVLSIQFFPDTQWLQLGDIDLVAATVLAILFIVDYIRCRLQPQVTVERKVASGLALNHWTTVRLQLHHSFKQNTRIEIYDGIPPLTIAEGEHMFIPIAPDQYTDKSYRLRPLERGPLTFEACHIRTYSPMGLCIKQYALPTVSHTKVYPDFAVIAAYTILAAENNTSELGIRTRNRRGQGMSFHQLREYRQGDSLRQLDWKATARRQKLISKEYQDERDQSVILLIDSGRRMRSKDDELSHFDHALNASILISYIALQQGDSVGVLNFGQSDRWIPPQKGADRVRVILNGLYDVHADNTAPDYLVAAERLVKLQSKRSLIVLVTNCRDEELEELQVAVKLLQKRHLVMVANIREAIIDKTLQEPVETYDEAASYAGTIEFQKLRTKVHQQFVSNGVFSADCLAKELPITLANSYWEIKRSGVL